MSLGLIQLAVTGIVSGLANNQAANTAFGAVATLFAGGTAPTAGNTGLPSPAGLVWRDTSVTPNQIKLRDDADTVWMPLWTIDQTGKTGAPYLSGVNAQTGTTYTVLATDLGKLVTFSNAGAIAVTLPQATTAGFGKGFWFAARCMAGSTGSATITPTTSTIDGAASIVIRPGQAAIIFSDGTNYRTTYVDAAVLDKSSTFTQPQTISYAGPNAFTITGGSANSIGFRINNTTPTRDYVIGVAGASGPYGAGYFFWYDNTASAGRFGIGPTGGAVFGNPAGLDLGAGNVNVAGGFYVNGVALALAPKFALFQNQQANATAFPTAFTTGSWQTFPITTEVSDPDGIASLSSNQITLGAGTYTVWWNCWGSRSSSTATLGSRLQNITDTATIGRGSQKTGSGSGVGGDNIGPSGQLTFTLAGSKAIELQVYMSGTGTWNTGSALSSGAVEIYANIHITKWS